MQPAQIRLGFKVLFKTGYGENAAVGNDYFELVTKRFSMGAHASKVRDVMKG